MKKFAIVLAGCGHIDGAEIQEATMAMLAVKKSGNDYQVFAPDINQHHVVNHLTGKPTNEKRNILIEAARIARGNIKNLKEYKPKDFDGLIFPGGFGVAKNLCTYAFDGANMKVNALVEKAIVETHKMNKPIGAMCISPILLAKVLKNVGITIGNDKSTIDDIIKLGGKHFITGYAEVAVDTDNNVFTTPCYMLETDIAKVYEGTQSMVNSMLDSI